ncbi:MAG: ABC transporter permease [Desulfonauticus sp.]|nr:ABC transporter permease [Desulfonauticus sp.]
MFYKFIYYLGKLFTEKIFTYLQALNVLYSVIPSFLTFKIFNRAVFRVFVRQLYFTTVESLSIVFAAALIVGGVVVNYILELLISLNSYGRIGEFIVTSVFYELSPLIVTIIMLVRSSTAVISELSVMRFHGEIDTLFFFDISIEDYVYLPRILAFFISSIVLNFYFIIVSLIGGYLFLGFFHEINYENYIYQIVNFLSFSDIFFTFLKSGIFGLILISISIQKGMSVSRSITEIPINLINGMMSIIIAILIVDSLFYLL